jgi:hypothetical protein
MTKTHAASTGRYLLDTSAVFAAGRLLQNSLNEDLDTLNYAVTRLSRAATKQGAGAKNYRAFMFSEMKPARKTPKKKNERIGEDVIASVLADLQVANVLVAAGHAVGEVEGNKRPEFLEVALHDLDQTGPVIGKGLSSSLAKGVTLQRFNFSGATVKKKTYSSANTESAIKTFKEVSDETLEQFVTGVYEVAVSVFEALKKLSPEKVLEALNQLGGPVKTITGMAQRLIKQGLQKMKQALDDLTRLIGIDAINKVRDKVEEIWKNREKGIVNQLLSKLIGVESTRAVITTILNGKGLDKTILDQRSNEVADLLIPYNEKTQIAKKIVSAISFGASLLVLTPIAGQKIALFAASSYFIVLASVMLIAMDYADSGTILRWVRGVGEIANSLSTKG